MQLDPEVKEFLKLKDDIKEDLRELFEKYLKIFDWDIPEANDIEASVLILSQMQKALDEIKEDVKNGKYANF